ncbi:MAG: adenosine kinase, partial [Bacteroidales bacterium]
MSTTNAKVLGMGNALIDIIINIQSDAELEKLGLPKGSMQLVDDVQAHSILDYFKNADKKLASGGSASNTIHGIANLGVPTALIGTIGKDEYGQFFANDAKESGITPFLIQRNMPSGNAITLMSPDSERTFATFLGAACTLSSEDLKADFFEGYTYLHIEGYLVQNYALMEEAMRLAKQAGLKISYDLASYNIVEDHLDFIKKMVTEYVDILFANEEEAKAFTGKEELEALDILSEYCPVSIVKIGCRGSLVKANGKVAVIP